MGWIELLISALLLVTAADAATTASRDSPTPPSKKPAMLRQTDARTRQYSSALRDGANGKPNFAGHYVLAQIGCGASCIQVAAIDPSTGRVAWFPGTISGWPLEVIEPLSFRRQSRLLVVRGMVNERPPARTGRYVFDGRHFLLLSTRHQPR